MWAAAGRGLMARLGQRGGGVGQVLEVGQAVEARGCALGEEGGGVVGAPGGGMEERVVGGVEGGEIGGGGEVPGELGGGAVDGRGELGEIEDIQGAVVIIISLRRYGAIGDHNLPVKPQLALAKRPPARVQLLDHIEHAVAVPQPLIQIDECDPQQVIVAVHRHHAAFNIGEEFFSAHGEPGIRMQGDQDVINGSRIPPNLILNALVDASDKSFLMSLLSLVNGQ